MRRWCRSPGCTCRSFRDSGSLYSGCGAGRSPAPLHVVRGETMPIPIIIDTDPGMDDALAILLALRSPELDVRGLTIVAGNVGSAQGAINARKILKAAGRCDVPIAVGADHPL